MAQITPLIELMAQKMLISFFFFFLFFSLDYVQRMAFHAQLLECYAKRHGYIMIPNVVHPKCTGPEWEEYSICWSRMCSMSKLDSIYVLQELRGN